MSRQAVAKQLSILELANLVSSRWKGRKKLHFLNAILIADAAEGWMSRFERHLSPLSALSRRPEEDESNERAVCGLFDSHLQGDCGPLLCALRACATPSLRPSLTGWDSHCSSGGPDVIARGGRR